MSQQYVCCKCEKTFAGGPTIVDGGSHCDGCAIEALTAANAKLQADLEQRRAAFIATEQRHLNQIAALKAQVVEVEQLRESNECYAAMKEGVTLRICGLEADLAAAQRDGELLRLACGQVFLELEERFSQSCRDANGEWKWDGATRFGLEAAIKIARHHLGDAIDAAIGKAGE